MVPAHARNSVCRWRAAPDLRRDLCNTSCRHAAPMRTRAATHHAAPRQGIAARADANTSRTVTSVIQSCLCRDLELNGMALRDSARGRAPPGRGPHRLCGLRARAHDRRPLGPRGRIHRGPPHRPLRRRRPGATLLRRAALCGRCVHLVCGGPPVACLGALLQARAVAGWRQSRRHCAPPSSFCPHLTRCNQKQLRPAPLVKRPRVAVQARDMPGHNASLAILGVFILWFGWCAPIPALPHPLCTSKPADADGCVHCTVLRV